MHPLVVHYYDRPKVNSHATIRTKPYTHQCRPASAFVEDQTLPARLPGQPGLRCGLKNFILNKRRGILRRRISVFVSSESMWTTHALSACTKPTLAPPIDRHLDRRLGRQMKWHLHCHLHCHLEGQLKSAGSLRERQLPSQQTARPEETILAINHFLKVSKTWFPQIYGLK